MLIIQDDWAVLTQGQIRAVTPKEDPPTITVSDEKRKIILKFETPEEVKKAYGRIVEAWIKELRSSHLTADLTDRRP